MGYLTNFIVYMLAMAGVLAVTVLIFKQATNGGNKVSGGKCLKVLDTLSIGPRKTLYIVSAGEEKFLIAGDTERTTLISKLNPRGGYEERIPAIMSSETDDFSTKSVREQAEIVTKNKLYTDRMGIRTTQKAPYSSVMRNLAEKISLSTAENIGGQGNE